MALEYYLGVIEIDGGSDEDEEDIMKGMDGDDSDEDKGKKKKKKGPGKGGAAGAD